MEEIVIDGLLRFTIEKRVDSVGYITLIVYSFDSWFEDNSPADYEHYLSVPVKFDGGFHFNFADEGYLFLDSESIKYHCVLMKKLYDIAKEHYRITHGWLWE
jgi:hypothetical protein